MEVVYNPVDVPTLGTSLTFRQEARAALGLAEDDWLLVSLGRLTPWKGQDILVEALRLLRQRRPDISFHGALVGEAMSSEKDFEAALRRQVAEAGLENRVHFLGFREDVHRVLGGADVLVHTSVLPEPFGRVIVEGMAAGVLVVAADAGGVPEIIQEGRTGFLVRSGDPEALAAVLEKVHDLPTTVRLQMAAAARAEAVRRFSTEAHVQQMQEIFLTAARRGVPPREIQPREASEP